MNAQNHQIQDIQIDRKTRAIEALLDADVPLEAINPMLADDSSLNQTRQILLYIAEMHLQIGGEQCGEAANRTNSDWTEGLGWILQACAVSIELHELARGVDWDRRQCGRGVQS